MVAAATTSLPERAEAGRNYDYRYVWIRDQCYAGQAVAAAGPHPLLDDAVRFVAARLLEHGDRPGPRLHHHRRTPCPTSATSDLPGYPGGPDIIGNWVNQQFQLDAFGEALLLFAAAAGHDRLDTDALEGRRSRRRRHHPPLDRTRRRHLGDRQPALDPQPADRRRRAARHRRRPPTPRPTPPTGSPWPTTSSPTPPRTPCTPPDTGNAPPTTRPWTPRCCCPALRGAVPADDPRTTATLHAYLRDLTRDGYAYRFRHDDRPLADAEGSFLLCGFLVALSLHQQGTSRSRPEPGTNAPAPPADHRNCSARNTTPTSTRCAATSPRPSSTP